MTKYTCRLYLLVPEEEKVRINKWIKDEIDREGGEWLVEVKRGEWEEKKEKGKKLYHFCAGMTKEEAKRLVSYICGENEVVEEREWEEGIKKIGENVERKREDLVIKCNVDIGIVENSGREVLDARKIQETSKLVIG